jgi:hypothetical protein
MFAKTIIDSDAFLDMPQSTQLLYFHLSMRADDDGFINKPKTIMRICGCKDDDIKLLIVKKFILPFDTGVVVIKHWRIHNYIQSDRKMPTNYKDELAMLELDENKAYRFPDCSPALITDECIVDGEIVDADCKTLRREAYAESSLPFSFVYKIRRAFWGKPCPVCGKPMQEGEYTHNSVPSIQHNTPISMGGKHEIGNISVICKSCNVSIKNNVTGDLNAEEVARVWEEINVSKTDTQVRLGKGRLVEDIDTPQEEAPKDKEPKQKDEKPFKIYGSEGVVKIIDDYYANLQRDFPQVAIDAAIEELTSYIVTTPKYKKDRHDKVLRGWPMDNVRKRHPELFNKSPSTPTKELDADILAVVQRANGGNK